MNNVLKQNLGKIIFSVIMLGLYFWHSDSFFIIIFFYVVILYLITTKVMPRKIWLTILTTIWFLLIIVSGVTFYVNRWLPHGPYYDTEFNTCDFNDGPCEAIYKEDLTNLDIPEWAKFFRENGISFFWGLLFAGIVISYKDKESLK